MPCRRRQRQRCTAEDTRGCRAINRKDATRLPEFYDGTYKYLRNIGILELDSESDMGIENKKLKVSPADDKGISDFEMPKDINEERKGVAQPVEEEISGEKIQDWVKRVLDYVFRYKVLSEEEIRCMHSFDYSKRTFGISFPLLVDTEREIKVSGRNRYWNKPMGKYYVCSQWWKDHDAEYTNKINQWLLKVLPNYKELGLSRN